jgi:C4-type Zn-finger protein
MSKWEAASDLEKKLDTFFAECHEFIDGQDDFELIIENAAGAPALTDRWVWGEDYRPLRISWCRHRYLKVRRWLDSLRR